MSNYIDIKAKRKEKGLSQQALADATGIPRDRIAKWELGNSSPKVEDYKTLIAFFEGAQTTKPVVKREVRAIGKNANMRLKPEDFAEAFPDWEGVPVYNTEVTASFVEKYTEEDGRWEPLYYLRDPQFRDCNFAARIAGDSMHSEIRHGDYIICQEITDKSIIVFGEIYYVVTTNGLQTCKYINAFPVYDPNYKGKTQLYDYDRVLLVPKNDSISPTPLHKNDILRLYKVRGIVRGY